MKRQEMTDQLKLGDEWDICVIGGGATGLGVAVDAASRGFRTVLFERFDFAKGTSSRSTKLVHGGVRYLQQGNIRLVMDALSERGLMMKNAPHLVKNQSFVIPNYEWPVTWGWVQLNSYPLKKHLQQRRRLTRPGYVEAYAIMTVNLMIREWRFTSR